MKALGKIAPAVVALAGILSIGGPFAPTASAMPVMQGPPPEGPWDAPPPEFREAERQGFVDGVQGAHRDFDNHRRPDVNNREEFRHPHVPHHDREAYRHGFERGYARGVEHLYGRGPGGPPPPRPY